MKTPTTFEISDDIEASMERDGANYTGNLTIRSRKLDDYDIYRLNPEKYWTLEFDSLSADWIWEVEGFAAWAEEMKSLVPAWFDGERK